MSWFALRVTYSRELKVQSLLNEAGFVTFVPMQKKKIERDGRKKEIIAPAVSNLCFVDAEKSQIEDFLKLMGADCPAHFYWDKANNRPVVIPDKAMQDFIHICRVMSDETLYLNEISEKLTRGQKVRVINGPFKGVEGVVVRIKRSRRVVVQLSGMLAVATAYVSPQDFEVL